ncbi:MAG: hypothetical protein IKZ51_08760 [Bacteroidales bacterium]|nr:hypothetical protein [Bacteroidales bacterium]
MKKIYAIIMMAAALAACVQIEQPEVVEEPEVIEEPETVQTYTLTVEATKGGDDASKALTLVGKTLNATWAEGESVTVYNKTTDELLGGSLVAQEAGTSTTLKGSLTSTKGISNGHVLTLKFLSPSYASQNGTLEYIAANCDYAEATVTVSDASTPSITTTDASFTNQQAIVKFTLKKKADNSNLEIPAATALTVSDGTNNYTVTPASATNELFVAIPATSTVNLSTTIGGIGYSYEKTSAGLLASKYYEITVKMVRGTVYLSQVTGDTVLLNGDVVTGTFQEYYQPRKISIADGATVTLDGVDINSSGWPSGNYAGLTCLGDATIILKNGTTNIVKGFSTSYPGVFIPSSHTLTIQGTGTLNASSNDSSYAAGIGGGSGIPCGNIIINSGTITATCGSYHSAGIGSGDESSCGDITINGGTVTATGGSYGAGIGSGFNGSSCGDIIISGGTVRATGGESGAGIGSGGYSSSCGAITISGGTVEATGGRNAAGIGGGEYSPCSAITIKNTVTSVTATKGEYAYNSIGKGYEYGDCGTVTIGGTEYYDGSAYQNDGDTYLSTSPLVYAPAPTVPTGAIDGKFTINDSGDKVYFSQGNLMYSDGTWSFHTNQYDMCFTSTGDVPAQYDEDGTFDLFGYGTSGHDYEPYMTNPNDNDYYSESIADTEYDWGVNAISNGGNTANSGWRTLTSNEWEYLLKDRDTDSNVRYAKATVNSVEGLIIFPDDWSKSYYDINNYNEYYEVYYSANEISSSAWTSSLEAHGAVFLPVSFYRNEGTICGINGTLSNYWSSTYNPYERSAYCLTLIEDKERDVNQLSAFGTAPTHLGAFVRLVKDAN